MVAGTIALLSAKLQFRTKITQPDLKLSRIELNSKEQFEEIAAQSLLKPIVIFKHSTRCNISAMVLDRLERNWSLSEDQADFYFLDLIRYREISGGVAERFDVEHESPQILLIRDGRCVFNVSHYDINPEEISKQIRQ